MDVRAVRLLEDVSSALPSAQLQERDAEIRGVDDKRPDDRGHSKQVVAEAPMHPLGLVTRGRL
jgi:hypothetical protein